MRCSFQRTSPRTCGERLGAKGKKERKKEHAMGMGSTQFKLRGPAGYEAQRAPAGHRYQGWCGEPIAQAHRDSFFFTQRQYLLWVSLPDRNRGGLAAGVSVPGLASHPLDTRSASVTRAAHMQQPASRRAPTAVRAAAAVLLHSAGSGTTRG